jgi:predicted enzyme related to lactoylglutathione lyase
MNLLVNVDVSDLGKAEDFYTRAFDLSVSRRIGSGIIELAGAPVPIYLLCKSAGSQATAGTGATRDFSRHWTPLHLDFVVADIEVAVAKAVRAGATLERAAQTSEWGKLALLADPFGNGFCLVEFIGRGYDEIATA